MGGLAELVLGLMVVTGIFTALGAAAMAFGTDSRRCIGDSRTSSRVGDWF